MKTVETNSRDRAVSRRLRRNALALATQASKTTQSAASVERKANQTIAELLSEGLALRQMVEARLALLRDGEDGVTPSRDELLELIRPLAAPGKPGAPGEPGEPGRPGKDAKGEVGPVPRHEWQGTKIRFEKPNNVWGKWVDLQGPASAKRSGSTERPAPIIIKQTVAAGTGEVSTLQVRTATSDTSIAAADDIVIVDAASPATVSLPAASSRTRPLHIKRIGAGAVTVQGAQTIDGDPLKLINTRYTALMLASTGAEWLIL